MGPLPSSLGNLRRDQSIAPKGVGGASCVGTDDLLHAMQVLSEPVQLGRQEQWASPRLGGFLDVEFLGALLHPYEGSQG